VSVVAAASLADAERRRGLNGLLVYTFFMVTGFAMLMPLVAVHFVEDIGLAVATVGGALAVRQLVQQGLAIGGGALADRYGARPMICIGVLLRALGFASLAFAQDLPMLFVAMVVSALGGALFEAPYQASIAALTTEQTRPRYYALSNWVSGVATTIGPLIGVALLRFDFKLVCLVAAGCFALNFVIAALLLPRIEIPEKPPALHHGFGLVLRDRPFMGLVGILLPYWFMAVQLNLSFPLLAQRLTGSADTIGLMFALSAGLTVVLQVPLVRWLEGKLDTTRVLLLGIVLMSISTGALGLATGVLSFMLCIAAFSIGAILTRPTQQTLIAQMANPRALGTFLGVSSLSLAVGGGIGNFAGGWLMDIAATRQWSLLPWLAFAAMGLLSALGVHCLNRIHGRSVDASR